MDYLADGIFDGRKKVKVKRFTCADGVDEPTQNHHFCLSPFLAIRRMLNRHCNEVDCKQNILQNYRIDTEKRESKVTSVDSAAYSECNAANDSALDTPIPVLKDDYRDLVKYQNIKPSTQRKSRKHLRFLRLSLLICSSSSLLRIGTVDFDMIMLSVGGALIVASIAD